MIQFVNRWDYLLYVRLFFVIFYIVGIVGIILPLTSQLMVSLTPIALLLSSLALIIFHKSDFNPKIFLVFVLIFIIGFFVEVLGVNTGLIFGSYSYGKTLGFKLLDTPLMIGVNWLLLVYTSSSLVQKFNINGFTKAVIATILMVFYDFLIEPVAPHIDMWSWDLGYAPAQNFFAWAAIAFAFHWLLIFSKIRIVNPLALIIFICQLFFFFILNLNF